MKYQVGDLINHREPGIAYIPRLGYIAHIELHWIRIVWFSDLVQYAYHDYTIYSWITNKKATHYPVGKQ